eukprot:1583067-Prymnesium_polylepis.1
MRQRALRAPSRRRALMRCRRRRHAHGGPACRGGSSKASPLATAHEMRWRWKLRCVLRVYGARHADGSRA